MKACVKEMQFFELPDKRQLCFAEYGDYTGFPIVYCHGFPACRLEAKLAETEARRLGLRLISIDRPGFGRSDFMPKRTMLDWPDDVIALMDHLRIEKFSVLGVSGGAPHAMSCALRLCERICTLGLVCGLGRLGDPQFPYKIRKPFSLLVKLFKSSPKVGFWVTRQLVGRLLTSFPASVFILIKNLASAEDKKLLSDPLVGSMIQNSYKEAFYQGSEGPAWEFYLFIQPWGFDLQQIKANTYLWHGDNDRTVPLAMGQHHAELIPHAQLKIFPGEGHFTVPIRYAGEILQTLRAAKP